MFDSEISQKEQLTRQKLLLNKTLGLDGGIGLATVGEELFKEEDLIIESSSVQCSVAQVFNDYNNFHFFDVIWV